MTREELLLTPNWTYKDVCFYANVGKSKAYELIKIAKTQFGGCVKYLPNCVKRNSILMVLGTSFEEEIKALRKEEYGKTL